MSNLPFRTDGAYVRRINPEKDLKNYKSTKLSKMWNIASGRKNEHFYNVLVFAEKSDYDDSNIQDETLGVSYTSYKGELLNIVDDERAKGALMNADYKNISYGGSSFEFENEQFSYRGSKYHNKLVLTIKNKETEETFNRSFRFIPWIYE